MWKNIRRWQQALVSRPGWAVFKVVKRAKLNEKDPHIEPDRARDYNRDIDLRFRILGISWDIHSVSIHSLFQHLWWMILVPRPSPSVEGEQLFCRDLSNDSNAQDSGLELVFVEGAGHSNSQMASTAVENSGFAVPPWEFHTAWVKVPIATALHPLAGPKWSDKNDGLKMAEVLRVLEVCFGTSWSISSCHGLHFAELRCYFAVSEACWRDLANIRMRPHGANWDQQEKRSVQKHWLRTPLFWGL